MIRIYVDCDWANTTEAKRFCEVRTESTKNAVIVIHLISDKRAAIAD